MTSFLETVFHLEKEEILRSKFRNTIYDGRTISEYFGEKPLQNGKEPPTFGRLLERFVFSKLPAFTYEDFIKYRRVYEKYPHLYLRYRDDPVYLVNIRDLCAHFDKYADQPETPVGFCRPSFFSRYHTVCFVNNETGEEHAERYPMEKNGKRSQTADRIFLHLFYSNGMYAEILKSVEWADYESLKAELKEEKRTERQKAVVERILTEDADLLKRLGQ